MYARGELMSAEYDETDLAIEADRRINLSKPMRHVRRVSSTTVPSPPITRQHCDDNLAKEYFGEAGMLGYVAGGVKRFVKVLPVLSTRTWLAQIWAMTTKSTSPVMQH